MSEYISNRLRLILDNIKLEKLPGFTYKVSRNGELLGIFAGDHYRMMGLVRDFEGWEDYQILGHIRANFGMSPENPIILNYMSDEAIRQIWAGVPPMISSEVKKAAKEAGIESGEVWVPFLNFDTATDMHIFNLGVKLARMEGYSDIDAVRFFVDGFNGVVKKTREQNIKYQIESPAQNTGQDE